MLSRDGNVTIKLLLVGQKNSEGKCEQSFGYRNHGNQPNTEDMVPVLIINNKFLKKLYSFQHIFFYLFQISKTHHISVAFQLVFLLSLWLVL